MKAQTHLIGLCATLLILVGCKGEPGPPGPLLYGTIHGYVRLNNEEGIRLTDHAGAIVSLEGTSFSTLTDSSGHWALNDVPTGIYSLVFQKSGYFEERMNEYQFLGGGTISTWPVDMVQFPTFLVSGISASSDTTSKVLTVQGTVSSASPFGRYVLVFFGTSRNVSFVDGMYVFGITAQAWADSILFQQILVMDSAQRMYYGLAGGQKLFVRAYPGAGVGPYFQYWPKIDKTLPRHFGTTPSNLDSVLVP